MTMKYIAIVLNYNKFLALSLIFASCVLFGSVTYAETNNPSYDNTFSINVHNNYAYRLFNLTLKIAPLTNNSHTQWLTPLPQQLGPYQVANAKIDYSPSYASFVIKFSYTDANDQKLLCSYVVIIAPGNSGFSLESSDDYNNISCITKEFNPAQDITIDIGPKNDL